MCDLWHGTNRMLCRRIAACSATRRSSITCSMFTSVPWWYMLASISCTTAANARVKPGEWIRATLLSIIARARRFSTLSTRCRIAV